MQWFEVGDEERYQAWVAANPDGFVLNGEIFHAVSADCHHFAKASTSSYPKGCDATQEGIKQARPGTRLCSICAGRI